MNLTRITDEAGAARQHFADAVSVLKFLPLPPGSSVIDVGTGAGFPGIPVKIIRPDISLALLDSSGKKTDFIKHSADKLGINVSVVCARAEEAAHEALRERFDACFSRAVAPLNMLLELCVPFLRTGGTFAAWKGESFEAELSEAKGALAALGCTVTGSHFIGPGAIILIEKQKPTPDIYPRRFSKIKSSPL
jgi:16S rRNA (guanine527-N7)-methyltransferase